MQQTERPAIIGLGYVGLPVAVALAARYDDVIGFDISAGRIDELRQGRDRTGEIDTAVLAASTLRFSADATSLAESNFFIVTVPTPIDGDRNPDLSPLRSACEIVGPALRPGAVVVFESTVYPGVTEDFCGPLLEQHSGLVRGKDFFLGYSPERINPGDRERRLETITKIIAAEDSSTLSRLREVYGRIVDAGLYEAPTIRVAEAAKVLENTQRDLNIALMNELALILDRMGIRTLDVLEAAGTKWNFLPFRPGLVGGHCIGVDPYYLTHASEKLGYRPEVILAGRAINDNMGQFVADKTASLLREANIPLAGARVAVLGLTFKENVPDIRNSRVPDVVKALAAHGMDVAVHDPHADASESSHEYGISLVDWDSLNELDAVVLAVNHQTYLENLNSLMSKLRTGGVLIDVKSAVPYGMTSTEIRHWTL